MKNRLTDLNDHLFAQIERLGDEALEGEKLQQEVARAKAVTGVASQIISNASLALNAQKALGDGVIKSVPDVIGIEAKGNG